MENTFWSSIKAYLADMPVPEGVAVILGLLYLVLAARQSLWCWPCAFLSTLIYLYIFKEVSLMSEVVLQVFYLAMAVFGFYEWRYGKKGNELPVSRFSVKQHVACIIAGLAGSWLLGMIMKNYFNASFPHLDAFVTVFAVITTFMVTYKILENWLYWLIIDALSIYLYWQKELYFTVLLFILYEVLVVLGYIRWKAEYIRQGNSAGHAR